MARLVLLNALPLNIFELREGEEISITIRRISIENLRDLVSQMNEVLCFIRHRATVELLSKMLNIDLEPSSELYRYRHGDRIAVITLRTPIRGQEISEVRPEDLEIFSIEVLKRSSNNI